MCKFERLPYRQLTDDLLTWRQFQCLLTTQGKAQCKYSGHNITFIYNHRLLGSTTCILSAVIPYVQYSFTYVQLGITLIS